jgi:predicted metal-dependent hydrolase
LSDALHHARERALERLRRHALVLAHAFELPLRSIDAESPRVRRRYGICYADGRIRIRLHQLRANELLKYSVMVDTLCHELAHLRHLNHGRRFWQLYRRILAYARRHGIYRPGPDVPAPRVAAFESLPLAVTRAMPRAPAPQPTPSGQLELF